MIAARPCINSARLRHFLGQGDVLCELNIQGILLRSKSAVGKAQGGGSQQAHLARTGSYLDIIAARLFSSVEESQCEYQKPQL